MFNWGEVIILVMGGTAPSSVNLHIGLNLPLNLLESTVKRIYRKVPIVGLQEGQCLFGGASVNTGGIAGENALKYIGRNPF